MALGPARSDLSPEELRDLLEGPGHAYTLEELRMTTLQPNPDDDVEGARVRYRVKARGTMEFRVFPMAYAPKIEMTIGFAR